MAKFIKGNLWNHVEKFNKKTSYIICPANNVIKSNGDLVMGAGFAKQVISFWDKNFDVTNLPAHAGLSIAMNSQREGFYGFVPVLGANSTRYGLDIFQSKNHWKNPSTIELITESTKIMALKMVNCEKILPEHTWHMACPGIGLGGLSLEKVKPILEVLPNIVYIYYL